MWNKDPSIKHTIPNNYFRLPIILAYSSFVCFSNVKHIITSLESTRLRVEFVIQVTSRELDMVSSNRANSYGQKRSNYCES